MKTLMLILIFFLISALFIVSNGNLHLNNSEEFAMFSSAYYQWFNNLFNNLVSMTGQVVHLDWLPSNNSTTSDKIEISP